MKFKENHVPEPETETEAVAMVAAGLAVLYNIHGAEGRSQKRDIAKRAVRTADSFITTYSVEDN